jgi:hypothetical protein
MNRKLSVKAFSQLLMTLPRFILAPKSHNFPESLFSTNKKIRKLTKRFLSLLEN